MRHREDKIKWLRLISSTYPFNPREIAAILSKLVIFLPELLRREVACLMMNKVAWWSLRNGTHSWTSTIPIGIIRIAWISLNSMLKRMQAKNSLSKRLLKYPIYFSPKGSYKISPSADFSWKNLKGEELPSRFKNGNKLRSE